MDRHEIIVDGVKYVKEESEGGQVRIVRSRENHACV